MKKPPKKTRRLRFYLLLLSLAAWLLYQLLAYSYKLGQIHALQWIISNVNTNSVNL